MQESFNTACRARGGLFGLTEVLRWLTVHAGAASRTARRPVLASALAILLSFPVDAAQSWKWTIETVDTAGTAASLATDQQGNVHIAYSGSGGIKYGFRPVGSSRWFTMAVDSIRGITKLALDAQGNPHICYTTNEMMKYASLEGDRWIIQRIDPGSGIQAYTCSVALAKDGTPHVTWYHEKNADGTPYGHFKYAVLRQGVWLARTVDFDLETGKWNSMVLDAQGNPHISYSAFRRGALKYAVWNGKSWNIVAVDDAHGQDTPGLGNSLVLDAQGRARVSYYTAESLKYAVQNDTGWTIQTIDSVTASPSWQGYHSSLALDQQGHPHISYEDAGILKHAYGDGEKWHIQILSGSGRFPYRWSSMAVDGNNTLYLAYTDSTDGSLKVAVGNLRSESAPAKGP